MNKEQQEKCKAVNPSRNGMWCHTYTGKRFYAMDPRPEDISILDIAHALSMTCRYGGHCNRFYSVAQHSVILSELVPRHLALAALLHDAPEAYLTDIPRPLKQTFIDHGLPLSDIEDKIYRVIAEKYGCQTEIPPLVKLLDYNIVADEANVLFNPIPEWVAWYTPLGVQIEPLGPTDAETAFLDAFGEYTLFEKQEN